jgi:hypothetical protein
MVWSLLIFWDDLKYHCVLVSQDVFVGYDHTITNGIGTTSFELVLPQIYPVYHHFWFDIFLCGHIFNAISAFQLYLLDMLSFYRIILCTIHHQDIIIDIIDVRHHFHPSCYYSIVYIFINFSITLQHRSQISRYVLHGTVCPSKLTSSSSELSSLNWHLIYLILVLLSL